MTTLVEFDRRYLSEKAVLRDVPDIGALGFHTVPHGSEWRLRLRIDHGATMFLKYFARLYPLRTYAVLETDEERRP